MTLEMYKFQLLLPLFSPLFYQSCPAAIDEMFNNKLHIIGGVGIGIGVIMVSLWTYLS